MCRSDGHVLFLWLSWLLVLSVVLLCGLWCFDSCFAGLDWLSCLLVSSELVHSSIHACCFDIGLNLVVGGRHVWHTARIAAGLRPFDL